MKVVWKEIVENFSHPDSQDMGKGEFVGSQLYIDDVELIYDYQE